MTFMEIVALSLYLLAGVLLGYRAWKDHKPLPQSQATVIEAPSDEVHESR